MHANASSESGLDHRVSQESRLHGHLGVREAGGRGTSAREAPLEQLLPQDGKLVPSAATSAAFSLAT